MYNQIRMKQQANRNLDFTKIRVDEQGFGFLQHKTWLRETNKDLEY